MDQQRHRQSQLQSVYCHATIYTIRAFLANSDLSGNPKKAECTKALFRLAGCFMDRFSRVSLLFSEHLLPIALPLLLASNGHDYLSVHSKQAKPINCWQQH